MSLASIEAAPIVTPQREKREVKGEMDEIYPDSAIRDFSSDGLLSLWQRAREGEHLCLGQLLLGPTERSLRKRKEERKEEKKEIKNNNKQTNCF